MKPTGMKRANRRAQLARKKRQALELYPYDHQAALANHLAHCSRSCCGNPRRHTGKRTLNELRQINVGDDEGKVLP